MLSKTRVIGQEDRQMGQIRWDLSIGWCPHQPKQFFENSGWLTCDYTGHEHVPQVDLINMNGRMYDAVLGRMLSPDKYVQDASNSQSYNRYSYVLNNPLKYTDPTGWKRLADVPQDINIDDDSRGGGMGGYIGKTDFINGVI